MIEANGYNSTLNKKRTLMNHQQIESLNIKSTTTRLIPANPLLQRKIIPINSPKFRSLKEYITPQQKFDYQHLNKVNVDPLNQENKTDQNQKEMCIDYYVNTSSMISKLVYLRNNRTVEGKICLDNIVNLNNQIHSKKQTILESIYQLQGEKDKTLFFESRFENGNLLAAFHKDENSYELLLQKDTNTTGYNQWFFFRVGNTKKKNKVQLEIINCLKQQSKYSKGITIWTYSDKKSKCEGIGWHHPHQNTDYYSNGLYYYKKEKKRYYFTLSFDYTFEYDDDYVYFANCIPYTYSDLMKDLADFQKSEITKYPFYHRKTLCTTLAGNDLDYITINNLKIEENNSVNIIKEKEAIVLIARQHPSESQSSWVMKGAIEFLLSKCEEASYIRDNFIVKIIPMMNPDGVIEGNTRTSFSGCDLNRRWSHPKELFHPEVYYAKELISKLSLQRKIYCLIDFQGHIGAFNSFFNCNIKQEEEFAFKTFPLITAIESERINYDQCTFDLEKSNKKSCRTSLFNIHIPNIMTLQTSNFGFTVGKYSNNYFDVNILKEIGKDVCLGILMNHYYSLNKMNKTIDLTVTDSLEKKYKNVIKELENKIKDEKENNIKQSALAQNNYYSNEESESNPSEDNISIEEIKKLLGSNNKIKKKQRNKQYNKSKLFGLIKLTNLKNFSPNNHNISNNIFDSKTTLNNNNANNSNNQSQTQTEINFPQLKPQNSNSIQLLKPVTNIPFAEYNLVEISSDPKRTAASLKLKTPTAKASIKTINSSSSENIITKESTLVPIQQSSVINVNSFKPTEQNNLSLTPKNKINIETQTEEIYFKMHWSYFLGTNQVMSSKFMNEQTHLMNKSFNLFIENNSLHELYMQKFSNLNKNKIMDNKEKGTRNNTEKLNNNIKSGGAKMNLMFNSIAEETPKIGKINQKEINNKKQHHNANKLS